MSVEWKSKPVEIDTDVNVYGESCFVLDIGMNNNVGIITLSSVQGDVMFASFDASSHSENLDEIVSNIDKIKSILSKVENTQVVSEHAFPTKMKADHESIAENLASHSNNYRDALQKGLVKTVLWANDVSMMDTLDVLERLDSNPSSKSSPEDIIKQKTNNIVNAAVALNKTKSDLPRKTVKADGAFNLVSGMHGQKLMKSLTSGFTAVLPAAFAPKPSLTN